MYLNVDIKLKNKIQPFPKELDMSYNMSIDIHKPNTPFPFHNNV